MQQLNRPLPANLILNRIITPGTIITRTFTPIHPIHTPSVVIIDFTTPIAAIGGDRISEGLTTEPF